jgi:hypothetical protein
MCDSMQAEAGPDIVLETGRLRLRRSAWGQGLATEASLAILAHGFERCFAYPEDVIAGRTEAERAAVKYSITRSAWLARRA